MFVFVLSDKEGRQVFKFRAAAIFQFDISDEHTLSVSNYMHDTGDETDASRVRDLRTRRRRPNDETDGS